MRRRLLPLVAIIGSTLCMMVPTTLWAAGEAEAASQELLRSQRVRELSDGLDTVSLVYGAVVAADQSPELQVAAASWIRTLRDVTTAVEQRRRSDSERLAIATERLAHHRRELLQERDRLVENSDRARLNARSAGDATRRDDGSAVRAIDDQIAVSDTLLPTDLTVPLHATISRTLEDPTMRRELPTAAALAEDADADLFLYLTVDVLDDLYLVGVRLWQAALGEDEELVRVAGTREEIPLRLEEQERLLARAISGIEFATITVVPQTTAGAVVPDARVYRDGAVAGFGEHVDRYVIPGTHEIEVVFPDGRRAFRELVVGPGEVVRELFIATGEAPPMIRLVSVPAGAAVYRGVEWVGFTPLSVPLQPHAVAYTLRREGYYDGRITVTPTGPREISRVLISTDDDWEATVARDRTRFYRSFGVFAVSVAAPVLFFGAYQNLSGLAPGGTIRSDLSAAEQREVQRQADTLIAGYYGSLGLSAVLFGNMIWRLVTYIQTAQGYHTR